MIYARPGIHETRPTWSPNGRKLAFVEADTRTFPHIDDLLVLDLDNPLDPPASLIPADSPLRNLDLGSISWAKKKNLLVVAAGQYPSYDLWCVDINNPSQPINLTERFDQQDALTDVDPSWSPDDSEIIFHRGGAAMTLTVNTANGCPDASAVTLSAVAGPKGKNTLWGFDWRRQSDN